MFDQSISSPPLKYNFASDNTSGICPEAWEALKKANEGYMPSYGNDVWTERASNLLKEFFEADCEVFFVFNGTAANSLALAACCQSYHSVICHEYSHIQQDECGAPEFFSNGTKLQSVSSNSPKLTSEDIVSLATRRTDLHYPKARAISVTQSTEFGTVYTGCELHELHETATRFGLSMHMDGARIIQAIASMDVAPKSITWQAGVDVLCCGGTKAGISATEAVIFFNRDLARDFEYRCKQAGQLASKMRFHAAGWVGLLENQAWLKYAKQANACASYLANGLVKAGLKLAHPVQSNAVFVHFSPEVSRQLRDMGWVYYDFIGGATRLMCSWKTTHLEIEAFLHDVQKVVDKVGKQVW